MARQMKDSGVDWIGKIPEEWRVGRIKDFAQLQTGATPSTSCPHYFNGNILWFTPGDFSESFVISKSQRTLSKKAEDEKQAVILPPQTPLIVGIGASAGKVSFSQVKCSCNQQVTALIDCSANPKLLTYILEAGRVYLRDTAAFTTLPIINNQTLGYFKIAVPNCDSEQLEIATYLDTKCAEIDKVVEQTRATIEEYKKLKQAIITEAVTKGVRGPRPMKPSGVEWIGDIPEEWEVKRIKYVLNNHDALRRPIAAENRSQKGDILYDYYGASGVIDQIDDYIIEGTYILIGEDGANLVLRNLPLVYVAKGKYWVNNHAHILSPKQGIEFNYIIHALESADYTTFITGTAQPKLSQGNLSQVSLPVPTTEEQQEIAAYLDTKCAEIDRIIKKKEQLIEELGSYKKSLIYEYVTGKKEVTA